MAIKRIYFWNKEKVYCPPAIQRRTFTILGTINRATLVVDFDPTGNWGLDKATYNELEISAPSNKFSEPIPVGNIVNGENSVKLDYSGAWLCFAGEGRQCTVYLETDITGTIGVSEPVDWGNILLWVVVLIIVMIVLIFALGYAGRVLR